MRFSIAEGLTGFTEVVSMAEGFMEGDSMVVGSMAGDMEDTADNGQRLTVRVRLGRW